ncbi:MAG: FG-GAP-like repeat-containing protein [Flavobacteriales bacterium]
MRTLPPSALIVALLFFAVSASAQYAPARSIRAHDCWFGGPSSYTAIYVDLDADGHEDIVRKGSVFTSRLGWQRWTPEGMAPWSPIGDELGLGIYVVLAGDFDGNGWVDVFVRADIGYYIIFNDGYGVFTETRFTSDDIWWDWLGVADMDADGSSDLFYSDGLTLFVLLNNGDATFAGPITSAIDSERIPILPMDVDGDGDLDLTSKDYGAGWYANDGTGAFGPAQTFSQFPDPGPFEFRDVDLDGLLDLVFVDGGGDSYVVENQGGGAFAVGAQLLSDDEQVFAFSLGQADIDGDGDADVLKQDGLHIDDDGSWTLASYWGYAAPDRFMDADGDGDLDVVGRNSNNGMEWYENEGGLFEVDPIPHSLYLDHQPPRSMDVADLDGDGDLDIALPNTGYFGPTLHDVPCWLPNNGNGTFGNARLIDDTMDYCAWISAGDVNGDGLPDLIHSGGWRPNLGNGVFGPPYPQLPSMEPPPTVRDFDGDGDLDVYWRLWGTVYVNNGTGTFSGFPDTPSLGFTTYYFFTDVDGDGRQDMFAEGYSQTGFGQGLHFYRQTAPLVFSDETLPDDNYDCPDDADGPLLLYYDRLELFDPATGVFTPFMFPEFSGSHVEFADLSGDGLKDLRFSGALLGWMERTGPTTFGPFVPLTSPVHEQYPQIIPADLDGNGRADLLVGSTDLNAVYWHENISDGTYRLSGTVFVDVDEDGSLDAGEPGLGYLYPVSVDDPSWQAFPDTSGTYSVYCNSGERTVQVSAPSFWEVTPATRTATVDATTPLVEDLDFALRPAYDTTAFTAWSSFGNLFCLTSANWPWYHAQTTTFGVNNLGTTLPDCRMDLVLSPGLTLEQPSALPMVAGDTLRWFFAAPYFSRNFQVDGRMAYTGAGPDLRAELFLYSTGGPGADSLVASATWEAQYFCSWDPNEKAVHPAGLGPLHAVDKNIDRLTYTIRFQNTGNAPANDVMLRDALSDDLDWPTLQVLAASHTLTSIQVENDGEAVFRFDGIQLPDSISDEPGSHGFVTFTIAPKADLENETRIENTASIFFDLNEPVLTNSTLTTLVDCALFPANITAGDGAELQASTGEQYQWFLDNDSIHGATMASLLPGLPGAYTVHVTNRYGCVNISAPYMFISTGIAIVDAQAFAIAPNPSLDNVRLFGTTPILSTDIVQVMDTYGRVLVVLTGNGSRTLNIDRNGLSAGLYLVRIMRSNVMLGSARMVFE